MKTFIKVVALTVIIFLTFGSVIMAQVTMEYRVHIYDSCSGSYSGYYCIYTVVGHAGVGTFCAHNDCSIRDISGDIYVTYQCTDWEVCDKNGGYFLTVSACRQSDCQGCKGGPSTTYNWTCDDLKDYNAFAPVTIK